MNKRSGKEKPNLSTYYPTIDGYLPFKEAQEHLVFHAENLRNAGYETSVIKHRVISIQSLLELLETYECIATSLKNK